MPDISHDIRHYFHKKELEVSWIDDPFFAGGYAIVNCELMATPVISDKHIGRNIKRIAHFDIFFNLPLEHESYGFTIMVK